MKGKNIKLIILIVGVVMIISLLIIFIVNRSKTDFYQYNKDNLQFSYDNTWQVVNDEVKGNLKIVTLVHQKGADLYLSTTKLLNEYKDIDLNTVAQNVFYDFSITQEQYELKYQEKQRKVNDFEVLEYYYENSNDKSFSVIMIGRKDQQLFMLNMFGEQREFALLVTSLNKILESIEIGD